MIFSQRRAAVSLRALIWRQILPLGLTGLALWLVGQQVARIEMAALAAALLSISGPQWSLAVLASAASFAAAARYDVVVQHWLGTGVRAEAAARAGFTAIALSQLLGFGLVTGTLVRARCLPGIGLGRAARITLVVGLSFATAWALLAALLYAGRGGYGPGGWLWLLLLGAVAAIAWRPPSRAPSLGLMLRLLALATADLICACMAFAVLFPETGPALIAALPPFVLAFGAGVLSGVPGGVGPFEAIISSQLDPDLPQLICAVVAFRIVHYACPAILASVVLLARQSPRVFEPAPLRLAHLPTEDPALTAAYRAESALGAPILCAGSRPLVALRRAGQAEVALFDRLDRDLPPPVLRIGLTIYAARQGRIPVLYKCGPRQAAEARRAGWSVRRVASEAVIDPRRFDMDAPGLGQLRRKLRQAERAGLRATLCLDAPPLKPMARVAADWSARHGAARSFSIGAYDPLDLPARLLFLATRAGRLVGFVTLFRSETEWTLDLVRTGDDAPDGTVQALIAAAIDAAADQDIARLSLAAVPTGDMLPPALARRLLARCGVPGLRRFKQAFAPAWEPRYIAAPGPVRLWIGAAEVMRAIGARPGRR